MSFQIRSSLRLREFRGLWVGFLVNICGQNPIPGAEIEWKRRQRALRSKTPAFTLKNTGKKLISDDLVCENRENRENPSLYRRFSDIPRIVGLNFPIFGSAGDKNHITVRFQIKSSPQTEIHTLSSPKTVSALFSTPWIFSNSLCYSVEPMYSY